MVRRVADPYRSSVTPLEVDFTRASIGQPQKITPPADASTKTAAKAGWDRDSFGIAFSALTLGVMSIEPSAGEAAAPARPDAERQDRARRQAHKQARPERVAPVRATPAAVKRAVDGRDVVVLLFRQRGADDDAVAASVAAVRGRGVTVFTIPVGQAPKYVEGRRLQRGPGPHDRRLRT